MKPPCLCGSTQGLASKSTKQKGNAGLQEFQNAVSQKCTTVYLFEDGEIIDDSSCGIAGTRCHKTASPELKQLRHATALLGATPLT